MADFHSEFAGVRNLVFDLGGVLYAIDPARTTAALTQLAGLGANSLPLDHPLFLDFEMGLLSPEAFRMGLRTNLDLRCDDAEIDAAWNALLLGLMEQRAAWIPKLAAHYRVVLLSNTNVIHSRIWLPQCATMFGQMERTWFSYEMHMRKPDPGIYQHVVDEMGMIAAECIFIDDSPPNLVGAAAIGMRTQCITQADDDGFETFCLKVLGKV
jgi:glucose-1-phosphatase